MNDNERSSDPMVAAVQNELMRQVFENVGMDAPWAGVFTETSVQVDGEIDIVALLAAIEAERGQSDD